jgi:signal transduction histidine kinase
MVTVLFVTVTAVILRQFMQRVTALFAAERDARAEAERAAVALAEASHHKTAFLANMSHELRTPLNVIIGFSEVLDSEAFGPLNPKQAEYVRDVLSSGRHLLALINDILALAKIDAGRMDLWLTEVDVDAVVSNALVPFRPEAVRRGIGIDLDLLAGDGVVADESKLVAAVGHLVSNALKFTPDGGRVVVRSARTAHETTVSVSDTGQGIEPGDHERIFDAFALGNAQSDQGTGLGLALARRYAELHAGTIEVSSALGQGATFTLRLPHRPATASAEVPA